MENKYIGHPSQLNGVTEMRMVGGKADGMRVLQVRNGMGLEFTVSIDRCADISYMYYNGNSMSYIAPCAMVAPKYYDNSDTNFLKSFTAGFITTCGLSTAGAPCEDKGEILPLHGNISHTPCENYSYSQDDEFIKIMATVRDASLFGHQFLLCREYLCSVKENKLVLTDIIKNIGCKQTPYMVLYHCNMGYPLLSENSVLKISSNKVVPRNEYAAKDLKSWDKMLIPSSNFVEQCYYHKFDGTPLITLSNKDINTKMEMTFDISSLDCFTEWKMMGEHEYVLGLEPANCYPDGRCVMREKGILKFLNAGECIKNKIEFKFTAC